MEQDERFRLAAIVESSDDAIISKSLDGIIQSWNSGAQRMFGYTGEEAIGQPITILIPPEGREEEVNILRRLAAGERITHYETVRVTKQGRRVAVSLSISPIRNIDGRIIGASKIARDITQKKQAEEAIRKSDERFRLASRTGKMFAYEWDVATDAIMRSGETTEILGVDEITPITGTQVISQVHSDDLERLKVAITNLRPEDPHLQITYRMVRPDGTTIWVERVSRAYFDEQGKMLRVVGMVRDITERKRAEEALSTISQRLIEAHEEERTRIARELHDDIIQRIAVLAASLEGFEQNPNASAVELREEIKTAVKQLMELGDDVQAISHQLHSAKLEYLGLEKAAEGLCREVADRHKVEIAFNSEAIPKKLPQDVALCLFRVLQEALKNAVKHSGSQRFDVSMTALPSEIQLQVCDVPG